MLHKLLLYELFYNDYTTRRLTVVSCLFIYSHDCKKNVGYCRVLKGGRFTIPKEVREKMSIKDGDFVDFLVTIYGSIKIIKFKFDWKRQ